jgi:hypothetical protein
LETSLSSKSTGEGSAVIRAAYIGLAGVVLAAVIAGAVTIYTSRSSNNGTPGPQGSTPVTPSASSTPSASASSSTGKTWTETTISRSQTFADYVNAGDPLGASLSLRQAVKVSCRIKGLAVADGDSWWYRLAQPPWNGRYYATTDDFYNTPTPTANPINGVVFDKRVPVC